MAKKNGLKTVERDEAAIEQQIREHRRKIAKIVCTILLLLAALIIALILWTELRTYDDFEVKNTSEKQDCSSTTFESFLTGIIEYTNDGIVYKTFEGELIWNQSFEMAEPVVDKCGNYVAVYDKGGTEIFVLNSKGLVKKMEMTKPITTLCVASQGSVAVLMKQDGIAYVQIFDEKGKQLTNGQYYENKGGFPIDIALSQDSKMLAVDSVDISGGSLTSVITFYNFGSVGQNEIDNNVGEYTFEGKLIPEIDYVNDDKLLGIADEEFIVFEGKQKPELAGEYVYDAKVQSLFHNDKYVGICYSNDTAEASFHIKVFDLKGKTIAENDTSIAYNDIHFINNDEISVANDFEVELYTIHGIRKFTYTFDVQLYAVVAGQGKQDYTFVLDGAVEEVRLK